MFKNTFLNCKINRRLTKDIFKIIEASNHFYSMLVILSFGKINMKITCKTEKNRLYNPYLCLLEICNPEKVEEEEQTMLDDMEYHKNFQKVIALRNHNKV